MKKVSLLFGLFLSFGVQAQHPLQFTATDPGAAPREHGVDFTYLLAELSFRPETKKVIGKVTHTFKAKRLGVDSIFLDAPGIHVSELRLNGKAFPYELMNQGIVLRFDPSPDTALVQTLEIQYTANPKRGLYFIGWDDRATPTGSKFGLKGKEPTTGIGFRCSTAKTTK